MTEGQGFTRSICRRRLNIARELGESINIMTLGGFALGVGILVDDVTVAIENSYRLMDQGKPFREAVAKGAAGIAKPALISTLSICGAFVSLLFLTGAPKYIFTPQALAVVFAMLASYFFSRTLVPILIDVLIKREYERREKARENKDTSSGKKGVFGRSPTVVRRAESGLTDRSAMCPDARISSVIVILIIRSTAIVMVRLQPKASHADIFEVPSSIREPVGRRIKPALTSGKTRTEADRGANCVRP